MWKQFAVLIALYCACCCATSTPLPSTFTTMVGLDFTRIPAGDFLMGYSQFPLPQSLTTGLDFRSMGDADELPFHNVTITRGFYMSTTEVTNIQYEAYSPMHILLRGHQGFSYNDDEAAVFISWFDAQDFTEWLSEADPQPFVLMHNQSIVRVVYRLPTEAEWEYAARAGSRTYFNTGDEYPESYWKFQNNSWWPAPMRSSPSDNPSLSVGQFRPNTWGLHDMHGNVEEWCSDWYGPYPAAHQNDPKGPNSGQFRVTRGGSHSTEIYYLRSANRAAAIPEDMSWYIGMRVVADVIIIKPQSESDAGEDDDVSPPVTAETTSDANKHGRENRHVRDNNVGGLRSLLESDNDVAAEAKESVPEGSQSDTNTITAGKKNISTPIFVGPLKYVNIDTKREAAGRPFLHHNHDPAVMWCPDGSIFAIWYSTWGEPGRELGVVSSRLEPNSTVWPTAKMFWDVPDRNDHAPALWQGDVTRRRTAAGETVIDVKAAATLYHFNGLSAAGTWGNLATIQRVSRDCGRTWDVARMIFPEHELRHQPVTTTIRTADGRLLMPCDNTTDGSGGTSVHSSIDDGLTWQDLGRIQPPPITGNRDILGIHGSVVELKNGSLLGVGRGNDINGFMAQSLNEDGLGLTWKYSASHFPGIQGGQRGVLMRLLEGPLIFISFANNPMPVVDAAGKTRNITGLYTALSVDEGDTWKYWKLVSSYPSTPVDVETLDGKIFQMSNTTGEPLGYLSARQSPVDMCVHLISSRQYYKFNLAWLTAPAPAE